MSADRRLAVTLQFNSPQSSGWETWVPQPKPGHPVVGESAAQVTVTVAVAAPGALDPASLMATTMNV